MIPLLTGVFVASLLGGMHCVAMCGGFVCFYSGGAEGSRASGLAHAAYHGGRLVAYAVLGAIAGALGAGVESIGAWAGIERAAAIAAGTLMIAWGAGALLRAANRGVASPAFAASARSPRIAASWAGRFRLRTFAWARTAIARVHGAPPATRALIVGLVSAFLPCGWLYAFVATAAGTAHPAAGALAMAVFWAGTVPLLAGLGVAVQSASGPLRRHLPVFTSILLMAVGLLTVAGKWAPHRGPIGAPGRGDCCATAAAPARAGVPGNAHVHH